MLQPVSQPELSSIYDKNIFSAKFSDLCGKCLRFWKVIPADGFCHLCEKSPRLQIHCGSFSHINQSISGAAWELHLLLPGQDTDKYKYKYKYRSINQLVELPGNYTCYYPGQTKLTLIKIFDCNYD